MTFKMGMKVIKTAVVLLVVDVMKEKVVIFPAIVRMDWRVFLAKSVLVLLLLPQYRPYDQQRHRRLYQRLEA